VHPRDAASLVILRRDGTPPRVLLGRRASRHRFMPDLYVFPGGRLDPADRGASVAAPLRPEVATRLARPGSAEKARSLAVAALRETFEETGLVFGQLRGGRLHPDLSRLDYVARAITPPDWPMRFHARFLLADAADAHGEPRDSSELHDLAWVPLADARDLPMADVTEFVLGEIGRRLQGARPAGVPLFHYRRGISRVSRR
jgi:8-oxo-dGTP pyrophosphatase MutT (NUDIX family)